MLTNKMKTKFFEIIDKIEYGKITISTPDGKTQVFEGIHSGVHGNINIYDWKVIKNLAIKGDIGFAEDYRDGLWDCENLEKVFLVGLQNEKAFNNFLYGSLISRVLSQISSLFTQNTINGSKKNIHAHYDLGNSFYKLWLDPTMTYSGAIFEDSMISLEQAQKNKYQRIIDCLGKKSGNILEVGCGWGGFAEEALEYGGDFTIKGITLSKEQKEYANNRLQNKAKIVLEDYRNQKGVYDAIVSIEMFEAVGEKFWPIYFKKMKSLLSPSGKAVVQTITIDNKYFENYRKSGDMIRTFIFPGGMLPSPIRFQEEAIRAGLVVSNIYDFGLDYAKTIEYWLSLFEENIDKIAKIGFDLKFTRLWRFYLASCIANFKIKRTSVMQVELSHA